MKSLNLPSCIAMIFLSRFFFKFCTNDLSIFKQNVYGEDSHENFLLGDEVYGS